MKTEKGVHTVQSPSSHKKTEKGFLQRRNLIRNKQLAQEAREGRAPAEASRRMAMCARPI